MKEIRLRNGKDDRVMLVDEDVYEWAEGYNWSANNYGYARRFVDGKFLYLHQELCPVPEGYVVDHINQNKLDNRRENLRAVTRSENKLNSATREGGRGNSKYRGVTKLKNGRFRVRVKKDGKVVFDSDYKDEEKAGRMYDLYALKFHGAYAVLNFPED